MALLGRFIVSKRLVVAEIALIEDDAVERVALATGVRICLCPMTKRVVLRDAPRDWITSLNVCVLVPQE